MTAIANAMVVCKDSQPKPGESVRRSDRNGFEASRLCFYIATHLKILDETVVGFTPVQGAGVLR